ncbi:hypothetical protein [Veillonella montpellierensis]|nr:hypothetical protein [Veillonella montpellierensis]
MMRYQRGSEHWDDRILIIFDAYASARGFYSKKLGPMMRFVVG